MFGFSGAHRRSELVPLRIEDVAVVGPWPGRAVAGARAAVDADRRSNSIAPGSEEDAQILGQQDVLIKHQPPSRDFPPEIDPP
jgi:hypothetical protein